MASRRRLGVALLLDPPHSHAIDGLRRALRDQSLERVAPHVTLVPPVNVRGADLPRALDLLRAAAAQCAAPLRLTFGPPATFAPDSNVLYLPVGGDFERLRRLRDDVFAAPLERSLAWPWVPHVTLADEADDATIEAALAALGGYQVVADVDRVVLLEERHPASGTRRWFPLADAALAAPAVVARGGLALTLVAGRVVDPDGRRLLSDVDASYNDDEPAAPRCRPELVVSALQEGHLVGLAMAWRDLAGAHVTVVVDPDQRRMGIGRHLLARTEDLLRRRGWDDPMLQAVGPGSFYAASSAWSATT